MSTKNVLAQELQSKIPDSLTEKTSKQLIDRIKSSSSTKSKIYENVLYNYADSALSLAQHSYDIASFFYNEEQYERSIYYLDKAVVFAKEIKNDSLLCKYFIKSGNAYLKEWKHQKSLDYYYQAINIAQKKGSIRHELIANSGIAIIHRRMEQYDKALDVCKKSLLLTENSSDKNTTNHVNLLTIISEIYLDQKKYDSVLHYADIGISMGESLDHPIGKIDLYTKKGIVSFYRDTIPEALSYFYLAEDILVKEKVTQKKSILNLNYFLARCFYAEKEHNKAISYLQKITSILEEKDSRNLRVIEVYRLLADCYLEIGNKEKSIYWLQKLMKLQDQFQDEKNKTVNKLHHKNTQELGNEIAALKEQKKKEEQYKEYTFFILIAVCIALIFIIFKYFRKQKNNTVRFNKLIERINALETKEKNQSKTVVINDKKVNDVLNGLHKLEHQEYFLNTDCDLRSMSKKVKTNTTYLSKIIKEHKADSFNDYINDLRIEYALKRLKNDKKFRSFSVKSIALELGYKTDNSFTKHFKSKTGLNPSYYIKKISTNDSSS
ncbi:tetratricopeptide repeat protein [Aquimarina sp. 2201CG5-10]|uniref:tetratricopeptide repeat protein n=1 Tax=Aquimarina callyspongiae TaxID=3098150 RepID=UPI002AB341A7|nr:tetratricopeptide repeat protein [Aquimarina sp. 2201CG5-10]MDY8137011.1 tetratricopeptide repeat protein [Aquimarina sp. 2201CG5-10]